MISSVAGESWLPAIHSIGVVAVTARIPSR
jgi:hypothetical protein